MKNILKISVLLFLFSSFQGKAQLDTLNYLRQFEYDKTEYLGKPFSKLLKKMALKPTIFSVWQDRNSCYYSSDFGFSDKNNFVFMIIVWEDCYISNPDFGMGNTNNTQKFTVKENNILKKKIIRDIIFFDNPGVPFRFTPHLKKKALDSYKLLSNNGIQYLGLRFEDFMCKTMPFVKVVRFKNIKNRGKVYKTVFTMKSHPTRNEDGTIAFMEIEWVKPIKANSLTMDDKDLTLKEIRIMKDLVIKSVKVNQSFSMEVK